MTHSTALSDRDLTVQARRRRARVATVKRLRFALPAAAGALVLLCVVQVVLRGPMVDAAGAKQAEERKMIGPRFSGKTRDGRSFVIVGKVGMNDAATQDRILISEPVLTLKTKAGGTSTATARSGVYAEAARKLTLNGDVRLDDGSGTRFLSEEAVIDTRTGKVSGQAGLRVESSAGNVESKSYEAQDEGDRVVFKGGVRGRLTPEK